MKDEQYLLSKYPDLLIGDSDHELLRLVRGLDTLATAEEPPHYVATSIEASLRERSTQVGRATRDIEFPISPDLAPGRGAVNMGQPVRRWKLWLPAAGMGLAIALLLLLVRAGDGILAVVPAAGNPTKTPIFLNSHDSRDGIGHLEAMGLGNEVNLSQTVNGYTLSVGWVYADGNVVFIRYDINPSSTEDGLLDINIWPIELRDDKGTLLPIISGGESTGTRHNRGLTYGVFDASHVADTSASLNLRLTTSLEGRTSASESRKRITPGVGTIRIDQQTVAGPFIFDFTVPFIPARVAHVEESVTVNGSTVTLEEFRVSVAEAWAIVHITTPSEQPNLEWRPTLDLAVGDWFPGLETYGVKFHGPIGSGMPVGSGQWASHWRGIPYRSQEEWTVTITELTGWDANLGPQVVLKGPWTFKVTLPPAEYK